MFGESETSVTGTTSLAGVRLPIDWSAFGFPSAWAAGDTVVCEGRVAWAWTGTAPDFGIAAFSAADPPPVRGWSVDHVVLLVPGIDDAVAELQAAGAELRLRMEVRGRPTAFFRVGTVLEVIETGVTVPGLYGVALATAEPLGAVVGRWRSAGHDISDIRDAIQPGRQIFTVRGLESGLVVMDLPG